MKTMDKKLFAMISAVVLLLGLTGCVAEDNPVTSGLSPQEKSLVGIWWDEYDYADVTEEGVPFTKVILVVQVDDDHTGCLYLGAFNDTDYYPVAVYGGKEDAGFKWALLDDGRVQLTDPKTGESYALARAATRGDGDTSYGNNMTNVATTNVTYTDNSVKVTNDSYDGTLEKADIEQAADIEDKLQSRFTGVNSGNSGVGYSGHGDGPARTRKR